jgi:hypothetical protein
VRFHNPDVDVPIPQKGRFPLTAMTDRKRPESVKYLNDRKIALELHVVIWERAAVIAPMPGDGERDDYDAGAAADQQRLTKRGPITRTGEDPTAGAYAGQIRNTRGK